MGARICRTDLRNDIGSLLSNHDHVGIEAPHERRCGQAARSSPFIFSIIYLFALFAALLMDSMMTQA